MYDNNMNSSINIDKCDAVEHLMKLEITLCGTRFVDIEVLKRIIMTLINAKEVKEMHISRQGPAQHRNVAYTEGNDTMKKAQTI